MTLTQLEIFALVAEMQGFTAAAARLGISQSGVSHAVRELERELAWNCCNGGRAGWS
ncbi:chromosome replication initiation inhibitor protein [Chromobacterium violaceum]|uniref:Chromosome replication initiation inhibitor protein n=1 Tax=Chromobacterium violaceum TaxID=536 RepID=A0A3S4LM04_CHRVL|nr:chromosome replication initiation inhibitor protein [Chromobacterium violaceum]